MLKNKEEMSRRSLDNQNNAFTEIFGGSISLGQKCEREQDLKDGKHDMPKGNFRKGEALICVSTKIFSSGDSS